MDVNASAATISNVVVVINSSGGTYSPIFNFDTGVWSFLTEAGVLGGQHMSNYTLVNSLLLLMVVMMVGTFIIQE